MMQHEKDELLRLLDTASRWCRHAEARDRRGQAVRFDDPAAAAWDLTGAVCLLFGWARALELFPQLERHLTGHNRAARRPRLLLKNEPRIISMVAVQEYNDCSEITYEQIRGRLESLPVYHPHASGAASTARVRGA